MQKVIDFEIYFYQILNTDGTLYADLPNNKQLLDLINNYQELLKMYKYMVKIRLFDAKAINLQKTGKLGTYPSCLWHEAIGVAIGSSMQAKDIFCPYYRDLGTMLWRGVAMEEILAYWGGDLSGSNFQQAKLDFPICVPIASQTLHAVGAGFAIKHQQLDKVVVTTVGDGGTSRGDFYEALNLAKIWRLPVVFVIINNKFAISTPQHQQTYSVTLAQKALAAGMTGEQVDGNDILALRSRLDLAIEQARDLSEPRLIEAITYRMSDHTTADDASRYRSDDEKNNYLISDPIIRLKKFLQANYTFTEQDELQVEQESKAEIATAVNNYFNLAKKSSKDLFINIYEQMPADLKIQQDSINKIV